MALSRQTAAGGKLRSEYERVLRLAPDEASDKKLRSLEKIIDQASAQMDPYINALKAARELLRFPSKSLPSLDIAVEQYDALVRLLEMDPLGKSVHKVRIEMMTQAVLHELHGRPNWRVAKRLLDTVFTQSDLKGFFGDAFRSRKAQLSELIDFSQRGETSKLEPAFKKHSMEQLQTLLAHHLHKLVAQRPAALSGLKLPPLASTHDVCAKVAAAATETTQISAASQKPGVYNVSSVMNHSWNAVRHSWRLTCMLAPNPPNWGENFTIVYNLKDVASQPAVKAYVAKNPELCSLKTQPPPQEAPQDVLGNGPSPSGVACTDGTAIHPKDVQATEPEKQQTATPGHSDAPESAPAAAEPERYRQKEHPISKPQKGKQSMKPFSLQHVRQSGPLEKSTIIDRREDPSVEIVSSENRHVATVSREDLQQIRQGDMEIAANMQHEYNVALQDLKRKMVEVDELKQKLEKIGQGIALLKKSSEIAGTVADTGAILPVPTAQAVEVPAVEDDMLSATAEEALSEAEEGEAAPPCAVAQPIEALEAARSRLRERVDDPLQDSLAVAARVQTQSTIAQEAHKGDEDRLAQLNEKEIGASPPPKATKVHATRTQGAIAQEALKENETRLTKVNEKRTGLYPSPKATKVHATRAARGQNEHQEVAPDISMEKETSKVHTSRAALERRGPASDNLLENLTHARPSPAHDSPLDEIEDVSDDEEENIPRLSPPKKRKELGELKVVSRLAAKTQKIHRRQKRVPWSESEVQSLRDGVSRYGVGKWAVILLRGQFGSTRTPIDLKDKWRNLCK